MAPAANSSIPMFALRNWRFWNSPGEIIGLGARRSHHTKATPSRIAACMRLSHRAR